MKNKHYSFPTVLSHNLLLLDGEIMTLPNNCISNVHDINRNEINPVFIDNKSINCSLNPDFIEEDSKKTKNV